MVDYKEWLGQLEQALEADRPDVTTKDLDPNAMHAAWSGGTAPRDFAALTPLPLRGAHSSYGHAEQKPTNLAPREYERRQRNLSKWIAFGIFLLPVFLIGLVPIIISVVQSNRLKNSRSESDTERASSDASLLKYRQKCVVVSVVTAVASYSLGLTLLMAWALQDFKNSFHGDSWDLSRITLGFTPEEYQRQFVGKWKPQPGSATNPFGEVEFMADHSVVLSTIHGKTPPLPCKETFIGETFTWEDMSFDETILDKDILTLFVSVLGLSPNPPSNNGPNKNLKSGNFMEQYHFVRE